MKPDEAPSEAAFEVVKIEEKSLDVEGPREEQTSGTKKRQTSKSRLSAEQPPVLNDKANMGSPVSKPRTTKKFTLAQQLVSKSITDRLNLNPVLGPSSTKVSPMKKNAYVMNRVKQMTEEPAQQPKALPQSYGVKPQPRK